MLALAPAFDMAGLAGAGTLAVFGIVIIPARRAAIRESVKSRVEELRLKLNSVLEIHCDAEINDSCSQLREVVSPFEHFVHDEKTKTEQELNKCTTLQNELKTISSLIEKLKTE